MLGGQWLPEARDSGLDCNMKRPHSPGGKKEGPPLGRHTAPKPSPTLVPMCCLTGMCADRLQVLGLGPGSPAARGEGTLIQGAWKCKHIEVLGTKHEHCATVSVPGNKREQPQPGLSLKTVGQEKRKRNQGATGGAAPCDEQQQRAATPQLPASAGGEGCGPVAPEVGGREKGDARTGGAAAAGGAAP